MTYYAMENKNLNVSQIVKKGNMYLHKNEIKLRQVILGYLDMLTFSKKMVFFNLNTTFLTEQLRT